MNILQRNIVKQFSNQNYIRGYFLIQNIKQWQGSHQLPGSNGGRQIHFLLRKPLKSKHSEKNMSVTNNYTLENIRQNSTKGPNIFARFAKYVGLKIDPKAIIRSNSYYLYETIADKLNYPVFFSKFNLPDTFNSWFKITELHVWMLSVRSMAEPENGTFIRNTLIEAMWIDVHNRANRLPAGASIIKKQIQELGDEFQYALIAYDEGLLTDDKTLASALWKRFFNSDCDDYQQIELLIKYVRKNIHNLDALTKEDFLMKRTINWSNIIELEKEGL